MMDAILGDVSISSRERHGAEQAAMMHKSNRRDACKQRALPRGSVSGKR